MMKGRVHVVARPGVVDGFALAGLLVTELAADSEAAERVVAIAEDETNALVLVEEPLFALVSETDRAELSKRAVPIVVPFPAPSWDETFAGPADYILALLQRAIGYRVRLQ